MRANARFVVDWDSTLVEDLYPDQGDWLPGAPEALRELSRHGDVVIFSCRVAGFEFPTARQAIYDRPRDPEVIAETVARMRAMLDAEGLGHAEIWQRPFKPNGTVYIDDKGLRFEGDWQATLDEVYKILAPVTTGKEIMLFREPGRSVADDFEIVPVDEADMDSYPEGFDTDPTSPGFVPPNLFGVPIIESDLVSPGKVYFIDETHVFPTDFLEFVHRLITKSIPDGPMTDSMPNRHPNSQRFHDLLKEAGDLHDMKQADYGAGNDPFANVRSSQDWGMPAWVGAMVRLNDKVKRLQKLAATGGLMNESAIDSFMDIAVYALIARVLYEEQGEEEEAA